MRVDRLIAFEVDDAEDLARFDFVDPVVAGANHLAVYGCRGIERALDQCLFDHDVLRESIFPC